MQLAYTHVHTDAHTQVSWFVASQALSMTVSFPLIVTGPRIVSALWAVFVYIEIIGKQNYIKLTFAILIAATANVLIAMSKI